MDEFTFALVVLEQWSGLCNSALLRGAIEDMVGSETDVVNIQSYQINGKDISVCAYSTKSRLASNMARQYIPLIVDEYRGVSLVG